MNETGAPRGQGHPGSSRAAFSAGGPRSAGAPGRGAEWDSLLDFNADPFAISMYHDAPASEAYLARAGASAMPRVGAPAAELTAWEDGGLDIHDMLFGHRSGASGSPSESYEEPFSAAAAARSGPPPSFAPPLEGAPQPRPQPTPRAASSGAWMCPDNLFLSDMSSGLSAPRRSGASGAMPYHFSGPGGVSDAAANRAWLGTEFGLGAVAVPPGARAAVKHEAPPRARAAGAGGAKAGTPKRKANAAVRQGASPAAPDGAPPRKRPHLKVKMPIQPQPAAFAAPAAAAGAAPPVVVRTKPRSVIAGRGPQPPLRLSVLTGAQGALHGGGARAGAVAAAPAAPLPLLVDAPPRAEALEARAPPPPVDEGRALADLQGALKNVDFAMRESIRDSLLRMSRSFADRAAARAAGVPAAQLPAFAAAVGGAEGGDGKTAKWLEAVDNGVGTLLYHPYWEDDNTSAAERAANMPHAMPPPVAAAGGDA